MDTTTTATLRPASTQRRDHSAHRRAYLDTYAKRRLGISETEVTPEVPASIPISAPVESYSPPYNPSLQVQPSHQPQVVAVPTLPTQASTAAINHTPIQQRRVYLDTLVKSHQQRVQAAPQAVETVIQPALTPVTEHLIETESSARIAANLDALYNQIPLTAQLEKSRSSASSAHIRTIVASALACGILSVGIFAYTTKYDVQPVIAQPIGAPVIEVEAPVNTAPAGAPVANREEGAVYADPSDPVRLIISSIGVNARVDGLGTTPEGLIAVPKSYGTVGWYNKGSTPGKSGASVLVGHYTGGFGGVFDKLQDVQDGDLITVKNGRGQAFTYRVTKKAEYQKDKVPMAEIFKKSDNSRLEIITCAGKWQSNTYDNRLVITAELV